MKKILIAVLILCLPLMAMAQVTFEMDGRTIGTIQKGSVRITTETSAPSPTPCVYTYSAWGACQSNGAQTRTVLTATPAGCTGTPILSQSCIYVPPTPTPTTWTKIAGEGQSFSVQGSKTVRYGAGNKWIEKVVTGSGMCNNTFFGNDPAPFVMKSCEVLSGTAPAPIPDPILPTPGPYDPSIPTIMSKLPPNKVNYGLQDTIVKGQGKSEKEYYLNLPLSLPKIDTATVRRDALILGQNYGQFEINVVDMSQIGALRITVFDPKGVEHLFPSPSQGLSLLKFQNAMPAYPGRYRLRVAVTAFPEGITQSVFQITWGSSPSPLVEELTK